MTYTLLQHLVLEGKTIHHNLCVVGYILCRDGILGIVGLNANSVDSLLGGKFVKSFIADALLIADTSIATAEDIGY